MPNFFEKIWEFLKHLVTRPGLQEFLKKYESLAVTEIGKLAKVHDNKGFHEWEAEAFALVQQETGELKGTWIAILINLAYESIKAKLPPEQQDEEGTATPVG